MRTEFEAGTIVRQQNGLHFIYELGIFSICNAYAQYLIFIFREV